jgi:hypothetical protein
MVSAGDIRQIVGEVCGTAGRSTGKAAAAPLIDLEGCDARSIERGGVVDTGYRTPPVPCSRITAGTLVAMPSGDCNRAPIMIVLPFQSTG